MKESTIYIVDDDPAMRDSLTWLVETIGHPVKSFESAQEFLDDYDRQGPGCLVLDVRLPGMSGMQLQQTMKNDGISIPIIIITGHGDIPMAVKAIKQGAVAFLEKPFRDQDLLDSIQEALVIDGDTRSKASQSAIIASNIELLTPREKEVMHLMVKGDPNKEIAKTCGISVKTVEIHRSRVMDKMKAGSLPELVHMVLSIEE